MVMLVLGSCLGWMISEVASDPYSSIILFLGLLMGSSSAHCENLPRGKIASSSLHQGDDILAVGILLGCPEFLVSLGY